jgi:hypothetical protein
MDGDVEGDDLSDTALDQFLASLGDNTEGGTGWVWPLFTDSALELQLGPNIEPTGSSVTDDAPGPYDGPSSVPATTTPNHPPPRPASSNNLFMSNKMVTAAAVLEHLPALYDVSHKRKTLSH